MKIHTRPIQILIIRIWIRRMQQQLHIYEEGSFENFRAGEEKTLYNNNYDRNRFNVIFVYCTLIVIISCTNLSSSYNFQRLAMTIVSMK